MTKGLSGTHRQIGMYQCDSVQSAPIAVGEGFYPSRAVQCCRYGRTNAKRYAPVGADDPVRPAVCTCKIERTNTNTHNVCRGRCPHRPARRTSVFTIRCGKTVVPIGRTEASAPTGRCAFSPKMRAILRLHPAGESAASTPTDILRCRRSLCVFDCAFCAGGASPSPTLRRATYLLSIP